MSLQQKKLQAHHRELSAEWKQIDKRLRAIRKQHGAVSTTVPIMRDGVVRFSLPRVRDEG